jgi:hypothetical protein
VDAVTRAAVLCRAGRYAEAVTLLADRSNAVALLYRALAEHGRGQPAEATKALEQAGQWLKAPRRDDPAQSNAARLTWHERLEIDLLRREVQELLQAKRKPAQVLPDAVAPAAARGEWLRSAR